MIKFDINISLIALVIGISTVSVITIGVLWYQKNNLEKELQVVLKDNIYKEFVLETQNTRIKEHSKSVENVKENIEISNIAIDTKIKDTILEVEEKLNNDSSIDSEYNIIKDTLHEFSKGI